MTKKFDLATYLNKASQPQTAKKNLQPEQAQLISVYDLDPHPENFYGVNDVESLAAMIELQGGVITPLEVKKGDNGKYIVIAGHRRRAAVLLLINKGSDISPLLPVYIRTYVNHQKEMEALVLSNRGQRKRTAEEITEEIRLLRPLAREIFEEEKAKGSVQGRFRKFFAEQILGISEASLQRRTQLANLSEDVKAEIGKSLTMTAASELAGLSPDQQVCVLNQVKEKEKPATVKHIQEAKRAASPAPVQSKKTSEKEEVTEKSSTDEATNLEPDFDPQRLNQIQELLLAHKKQIAHELTELVLLLQDSIENQAVVMVNFEKLENALTAVNADIAVMKRG
ncbi:ParB/RepB/Spo0J family partition protein [Anaerospora hongkongensis]|uniref:ParB/RepB/Spo0J family partition protein n=1 Tax=Anaerospora hongkongensis TaxID=244830 RepID=UPI002FD90107